MVVFRSPPRRHRTRIGLGSQSRGDLHPRRYSGCEPSGLPTISNRNEYNMAEGTIKRLTDRGFGFIETSPGNDIFFHMSNVEGVRFEELREGQRVSFDEGQGPKGPRAENVRPL